MTTIVLLVTLALGVLVAPLTAEAQSPAKVYRIGVLFADSLPSDSDWQQQSPFWSHFWQGMRELGWIEGQNILVNAAGLSRGSIASPPLPWS
jgi:hypothetical protein